MNFHAQRAAVLAALLGVASAALAQDPTAAFPNKPIRWVVPFAP
ncbi:MAG: tripartite tricarboxylate transporter substrate binding protein, partial [Betaproteobacteria bacterium]|nr:tripartite tricarboxylate transporter substrate binding protein [Betaproteobacteria bacterium]